MGLAVAYLQERLAKDKNPLLKVYNPQEYQRLAYYTVEKHSIEVGDKPYEWHNSNEPTEILLEKDVDLKRQEQEKKKEKPKTTE